MPHIHKHKPHPLFVAFAPGMDLTQSGNGLTNTYHPVFFGARRDYTDDSQGWIVVTRGKRASKKYRAAY